MSERPYSKAEFQSLWGPSGYTETFCYNLALRDVLIGLIAEANGDAALDIGCGSGVWTAQFLAPRFREVVAIDVMPGLSVEPRPDNIRYIELGEGDYTCGGLPDGSFDLVYSHGVFCHLPNSAAEVYLKSIRRVMRDDGMAIVMFPDCTRWRSRTTPDHREGSSPDGWFYYDAETVRRLVAAAGLAFKDATPYNRDITAVLRKAP